MNLKVLLSDLHGIYVRVRHFRIARAAFYDINWQSGIKKKAFLYFARLSFYGEIIAFLF